MDRLSEAFQRVGKGGKSEVVWRRTLEWCIAHPDQKAAIVRPDGTFSISFAPRPDYLKGAAT